MKSRTFARLLAAIALASTALSFASPRNASAMKVTPTEANLCQANWAYIAKAGAPTYSPAAGPNAHFKVMTRVPLTRVSVYHGNPPPTVDAVVPGGILGSQFWTWHPWPTFLEGEYYFLLASHDLTETPPSKNGIIISYAERIPPESIQTIPPAEGSRIWDEHCGPPAAAQAAQGATQPYISLLPAEFLDVCEHY